MSTYLLSVVGTVLLCSLLIALSPEGKTSAVIKGMTRLVCVLTIVAPIFHFFYTNDTKKNKTTMQIFEETGIQTDKSFIQYYSELRIRETERSLKKELEEKFDLSASVEIKWDTETDIYAGIYDYDRIKILQIILTVENVIDEEVEKEMLEYLKKNYCSEVRLE